MFFNQHQTLLPLYEVFAGKMAERFPDTKTKVQKTRIIFSNRHVWQMVNLSNYLKMIVFIGEARLRFLAVIDVIVL